MTPELVARIAAAARRREVLRAREDLTAYRLLNADGDGVPDVTLDRFDDVCVLSLYRDLPAEDEALLEDACERVHAPRALYLKRRPREARVAANVARQEVSPAAPVRGAEVESVTVLESGLRFLIRPGAGLSVGLFLDMREVRAWLGARVRGRAVLNCFSYTCAFSVAARAGGAARVANVDLSRRVLDWGEENHALNGLPTERRDFIAGDVFEWLRRFARKQERFDVVVLDPPSFATSSGGRFSAARDYPELVRAALGVLPAGGLLLACCNLASIDDPAFERLVERGFDLAGRRAGERSRLGASDIDFPPHPESPHALHVLAVQT